MKIALADPLGAYGIASKKVYPEDSVDGQSFKGLSP